MRETEKTIMPASNMPPIPKKKKRFKMLDRVKDFLREQSGDVKKELNGIIWMLERDGFLAYPYGEKIEGDDELFAIRVMQSGNIRIFYVYGLNDFVFGLHAYVKKTERIPAKELKEARRALLELISGGCIK